MILEPMIDLYIGENAFGVSVRSLSDTLIINFRINYNNCD
jgi:hypothetical protein